MFDIVAIVVVALFFLRGMWKGLVRQVVGFLGVIVGYMLAMRFSGPIAIKYFSGFTPATGHIIGFLIVFVVCIMAASLIASLIARLITVTGLGALNRIGGAILGGAKGCFIVAVVTMILIAFSGPEGSVLKGSRTLHYIRPMADMVSGFAPESVKRKYDENITNDHPREDRHNTPQPEKPLPRERHRQKKEIDV